MKFMGSKRRIAKHILSIILKDRQPDQWYVEPFVGGGNMIDKVDGLRLGADYDKDVISALTLIRDNPELLPKNNKEFTEADYKAMKQTPDHPLHGYVGFTLSFGSMKWGGWSRNKRNADYVAEAYRSALKQSPKLQGVVLKHCSYDELNIPPNSIIYCDPPYKGTAKYKVGIDHDKFWEWCRQKHKEGHQIFISEYKAPDDFTCVWSKEIYSDLTPNANSKKGIERLFTLEY